MEKYYKRITVEYLKSSRLTTLLSYSFVNICSE
uniref:Uncharacterized protein n=1 Tax=Siphoviridae sp. ctCIv11 TaxID=2827806 RepID=A0A8S5S247_9CAUD|nr:MAG TPA: hypothetical protein [Siphoviridae sp. ctCIv11]DAO12241.1 MAG TPA: hypothetical protein [Bacteriophage sp.]